MILYKEDYNFLRTHLKDYSGRFSSIVISGSYGKGKTTLIRQVLESLENNTLIICQYPGMDTPFEAISSALYRKVEENNYNIGEINSEISHREYIKQLFINICRQTPDIIVVIHDMRDFQLNSMELIKEIMDYLRFHAIPCHIIIEYSSDNLSFDQRDTLFQYNKICTSSEIKLNQKEMGIYVEYFFRLLPGRIQISPKQIESIIKEAFYNPALIQKMVYYFSDMGIFFQEDDSWYSEELDFKLTAKLFEKNIHQRYENLDDILQSTLNKASITGYEINSKLLCRPLGILKSEENLRRIERLSRLIISTENNYQFENNTVYNLINDKVSSSEKKALHQLIANYLYEKLDTYIKTDTPNVLRILYIIKNHYINAEDMEKALHIIGCYIEYAYRLRNYDAALSGINEFLDLSDGEYIYAEQQIIYLETKIHGILGAFSKASERLKNINIKYLPTGSKYWLRYTNAYFLFNSGKIGNALKIAEELISKIDDGQIKDKLLLIKLDILLAGMYHHFGNIRDAFRRYEQALANTAENIIYRKEYYYLLSISNMFLDNEFAIPKIEESLKFFKEQQLLISYAKSANNVAINYIYTGNFQLACERLQESYKIFDDICSTSSHYPLNNLATVYAYRQDYITAEETFTKALQNDIEPFSTVWISINISHCKRKQKKWAECKAILDDTEKKIEKWEENAYLLRRNQNIAWGLLYLDLQEFSTAYEKLLEALKIELQLLHNDTYPIFLSKLLLQISEMANLPFPDIARPYKKSYADFASQILLDTRTHWGNFLFWEI